MNFVAQSVPALSQMALKFMGLIMQGINATSVALAQRVTIAIVAVVESFTDLII